MKKDKKLVIIGAGETARLAYEYFRLDSSYEVEAFAVNRGHAKSSSYLGLPLIALEDLERVYNQESHGVFVAMGSGHLNRDRQKIYECVKLMGYNCVSYISSKAFVWSDVTIGENCFILENNVLQSGVKIGNNVVLWSGNHIGHMSEVHDNCFISSHVVISGNTIVGKNCFIGVNSSVADNIRIADNNYIGLGSIINKSTDENSVYFNNTTMKSAASAKRLCKVKE